MDLQFLTKDEAAERLRVPVRYLEAEIKAGRGPVVTKIGERKTRIRLDLFEEWLQKCTINPAGSSSPQASAA